MEIRLEKGGGKGCFGISTGGTKFGEWRQVESGGPRKNEGLRFEPSFFPPPNR